MQTGILSYEQKWAVNGFWELNYLVILISVAVLWRPHPDAKNYAYVMELSSDANDMDMETSIEMVEDDTTDKTFQISSSEDEEKPSTGMDCWRTNGWTRFLPLASDITCIITTYYTKIFKNEK